MFIFWYQATSHDRRGRSSDVSYRRRYRFFARDKARHIRAEIEYYIGDIGRISYSARRQMHGICAFVNSIIIINPIRGDGVATYLARKADCKYVRECGDVAFCRCVTLGLRLAYLIAGGDNDNACILRQKCGARSLER